MNALTANHSLTMTQGRSAQAPAGADSASSRLTSGRRLFASALTPGERSFRLNRRGRFLLLGMPAILVLLAFFMSIGMAASGAMASSSAEVSTVRVTIESGETLWSVAQKANPQADTREVVRDIMKLNGLRSETLGAGEQISVPVYTR